MTAYLNNVLDKGCWAPCSTKDVEHGDARQKEKRY